MNTKLQKARVRLLLDEPFFGALLLNLKMVEKPGIGTMRTDSVQIQYDPVFVEKLSDVCLKTVLAHEVMHVANQHCFRRGERDPKQWNIAADYSVNGLLDACNEAAKLKGRPAPFVFPEGALLDARHKGKSAEQIYGELSQKPKEDPNGQGQSNQPGSQPGQGPPNPGSKPGTKPGKAGSGTTEDPGGMGGVEDYQAATEAEETEQEARWKVALSQAANMAKGRGDLPGQLARMIGDILEPKADWRELLRRFVRDRATNDFSWSKPNPRYLQSGFILPSLYSEQMGRIVVAIDTSGSIDQDMLNAFMTEVESIVHEARPSKLTLIDCDARINSVREFEPGDTLPRDFSGGGGTDFSPVWKYLSQDDPPVCAIYLTDLDGRIGTEPNFPVIWACTTDRIAPWGETVQLT